MRRWRLSPYTIAIPTVIWVQSSALYAAACAPTPANSATGAMRVLETKPSIAWYTNARMSIGTACCSPDFSRRTGLLIEPGLGVAVTLEECEELAKDEGIDKWALAARFAQGMLPQVFRPDHPVFEVRLAREHRLKLEGLVENLPAEVFTATDSLGWVYQFWQSRKKAEVNRSEVKIGADELPAVTQLFTEPYMVSFLLDNWLGSLVGGT